MFLWIYDLCFQQNIKAFLLSSYIPSNFLTITIDFVTVHLSVDFQLSATSSSIKNRIALYTNKKWNK